MGKTIIENAALVEAIEKAVKDMPPGAAWDPHAKAWTWMASTPKRPPTDAEIVNAMAWALDHGSPDWSALVRVWLADQADYAHLSAADEGTVIDLDTPSGAFRRTLRVVERRTDLSTGKEGAIADVNGECWWLLPGEVRVLGGRDA